MTTLYIPADRLQQAILDFAQASALRFCTTVTSRGDDTVAVTASWPVEGFSTGERIAWDLLASMVDGTLRQAFERLDAENLRALADVLTELHDGLVA